MLLVIDNYDSFTFNLVQLFGSLGADPQVYRNDALTVSDVARLAPTAIVIGPGPGAPRDAGISVDLIRQFGPTTPLLGVCLGHQAIGEAYGGTIIRAPRGVMHGKTSAVSHGATGLFAGIPSPVMVMRYHSLVIAEEGFPSDLAVTATAEDDTSEIHAVQHRVHPVCGVQFHPESIGTEHGRTMLTNFLEMVRPARC